MSFGNHIQALTCCIALYLTVGGDNRRIPHLGVFAEVGGHDLFTSLAQLEILWHNEIKIVNLMEEMIMKMERAKRSLRQ